MSNPYEPPQVVDPPPSWARRWQVARVLALLLITFISSVAGLLAIVIVSVAGIFSGHPWWGVLGLILSAVYWRATLFLIDRYLAGRV